MKSYLLALSLVAAAIGGMMAGCATSPEDVSDPTLAFEHSGDAYISPAASPGVKDSFSTALRATTPEETVPQAFRVRVTRPDGETVYEERRATEDGGLFSGPQPLDLPDKISWNGTNSGGTPVAEGTYELEATLTDSIGQRATAGPKTVVVDNTPPTAGVEAPYRIFSPDGDGNKDSIAFEQWGTQERLWEAEITNADGEVVYRQSWRNTAPPEMTWNGVTDDGASVPNGSYRYVLRGTDAAGNTQSAEITEIRVNTESYTVSISPAYTAFSPNGDGNRDELPLAIEAPRGVGITEWRLALLDADGTVVERHTGAGAPPRTLTFNGRVEGQPLPEGIYRGRLSVVYRNGSRPTATTDAIEVDVTPPAASVMANYQVFSPNGDGNKETLTITQSGAEARRWEASIRNVDSGETILTESWTETPPDLYRWHGHGGGTEADDTGDGAAEADDAPDGRYRYVLRGRDAAGNTTTVRTSVFRKDTSRVPEISLRPEHRYFSPNDDGVKDTLVLDPGVGTAEGLERYRFAVRHLTDDSAEGQIVYEETGTEELPEAFTWDGTDGDGQPLPNGAYEAKLSAFYRNGNAPTVTTETLRIDRTPPRVDVTTAYTWFSPDGDGRRDTVRISQSSSEEERWRASILNEGGETVYSDVWEGSVEDFTWEGRNQDGQTVPDGRYTYRITATDRAGNTTSKTVQGLRVDTREPTVRLEAGSTGFSPNSNGIQDVLRFDLSVEYPEAVASWQLDILESDGARVMRYGGGEDTPIPDTVQWPGTTENGDPAPEGSYRATLTVSYVKGNRPVARTDGTFALDRSAPTVSASISPTLFTPDDDGENDTLSIDIRATDNRSVDTWRIDIADPTGSDFATLSGSGNPAEPVTWDGRSEDGELVQSAQDYSAVITVSDPFGNRASTQKEVPVGILVIRDRTGDLRIRITSIHFAPFEADFTDLSDPRLVEENVQTLDRLAEILKEYSDYRIRIEGHAVQIYYYDEELAREEQRQTLLPLSRERARVIKQALVERGVDSDRMSTVGVGGAEPVVPHGDLENRWKNRRVQFELIREESSRR